jgi:hypothetical protein
VDAIDAATQLEVYRARVDTYNASAEAYLSRFDALKYMVLQAGAGIAAGPEGLSEDQLAAHMVLHDLVTPNVFELLIKADGFTQVTRFWCVKGKEKFCCAKPRPLAFGDFGYADGNHFTESMHLNQDWMAKIEVDSPRIPTRWEKLKGWLRGNN